jgi:hypothetical protein
MWPAPGAKKTKAESQNKTGHLAPQLPSAATVKHH